MSAKIVQQKGHRFYTAIVTRDGRVEAEHIYAAGDADARTRAGEGLRFLFVGKHAPIVSDNGFMGPKTRRYAAVLAGADGALRIEHAIGSSSACVHARAHDLGLMVALIFREGAEPLRDVEEMRREREERRRTAPRTLEDLAAQAFGSTPPVGFDVAHLERAFRANCPPGADPDDPHHRDRSPLGRCPGGDSRRAHRAPERRGEGVRRARRAHRRQDRRYGR